MRSGCYGMSKKYVTGGESCYMECEQYGMSIRWGGGRSTQKKDSLLLCSRDEVEGWKCEVIVNEQIIYVKLVIGKQIVNIVSAYLVVWASRPCGPSGWLVMSRLIQVRLPHTNKSGFAISATDR